MEQWLEFTWGIEDIKKNRLCIGFLIIICDVPMALSAQTWYIYLKESIY